MPWHSKKGGADDDTLVEKHPKSKPIRHHRRSWPLMSTMDIPLLQQAESKAGMPGNSTKRHPTTLTGHGTLLRALIIEDDRDDAEIIVSTLTRAGFKLVHQTVASPDDLIKALDNSTWDIVIADHVMPAFSSTAALKILDQGPYDVPLLVLSGKMDPQSLSSVLRAGAFAALDKADIAALPEMVDKVIQLSRDMLARVQAEADLEALRNSLTASITTNIEHLTSAFDNHDTEVRAFIEDTQQQSVDQVAKIVDIITRHAEHEEEVLVAIKKSVTDANDMYVKTVENFGRISASIDALPDKLAAAIRKPAGKMSWIELIKEQPDRAITLGVIVILAIVLLISQGHSLWFAK